MGVFEFLTISIVAIASGSVIKAWLKSRTQTRLLEAAEHNNRQLEARLGVLEEIVTGTQSLERMAAELPPMAEPALLDHSHRAAQRIL